MFRSGATRRRYHVRVPNAATEYFQKLVLHETRLWNAVERKVVSAGGLNLARLHMLRVVVETPTCRVQDIAETLDITIGAASRLTDRLVADGLVVRVPNANDRRSSLVRTTPHGVASYEASERHFEEAATELLSDLGDDRLRAAASFIGLADHLVLQGRTGQAS